MSGIILALIFTYGVPALIVWLVLRALIREWKKP